jgi:predicted RNase H-like HicB family nuclease
MFMEYIDSAMQRAKYKILEDQTYYGQIPGFKGVWADAKSLEDCRKTLQEVLEGWVLLKVRHGDNLPTIHGKRLKLPNLVPA